ncbi:glycosyltransferase [Actinomadura harenae]|nr:glycosyltransferase [Actinomadura harenae]
MRILVTTTSWRGLYFCMVPLGWAFQAAGHEVRVTCARSQSESISRAGLTAVPIGEDLDFMRLERLARFEAAERRDAAGGTGTAALLHPVTGEPIAGVGDCRPGERGDGYRQEFARLSLRGHDAVVEYARLWRPDLIVHDAMCGEGVLAAEVTGVPSVYCSPGLFGGNEVSLGSPEAFAKYGVARDHSLIRHTLDPTPVEIGIDHGGRSVLPVRYQPYNGPGEVPAWLSEEPKRPRIAVIVNRGTTGIFGPVPALRRAIDRVVALGAEPVVTVSRHRVDSLDGLAGEARVLADFPLNLLMPTSTAIIHHGSVSAIMTAAAAGIPQLALGLTDDGTEMARRYSRTGAGTCLPGLEATGDQISAAVDALLTDDGLRDAARRVRNDISGRPSMADMVAPLEELAGSAR